VQIRSITAVPDNPWRFGAAAVFGHLHVFCQRLTDLADICTTTLQFSRLERIEVGGSDVSHLPLSPSLGAHQVACERNGY
jgi:hypothetical protein